MDKRELSRIRHDLGRTQVQLAQLLGASVKAPLREVQRANILLQYSVDIPIIDIEKMVDVSRPTVYKWIEKAWAMAVDEGLKDKYHRPKEPVITDQAKAWIINLTCQKPTEYGYAATRSKNRLTKAA